MANELNELNKISIYASEAETGSGSEISTSIGYCYKDDAWKGLPERSRGAVSDVARSIDYNTAVRQATLMSTVLAEMMVLRNGDSKAYSPMSTLGIGTSFESGEENIEKHAVNLAAILDKDHFLMTGEVTTDKINDKAVTTSKIADNTITQAQIGNIITLSGNATTESSANGMKIRLYQDSNKGGLKVEFTGNSATQADKLKINTSSEERYIVGSPSSSNYNSLTVDTRIKTKSGYLYSSGLYATGVVQANSFNATSDIRLKENINTLDSNLVKEIVDNVYTVTFNYRDKDEKTFGLIAQDLLKFDSEIKLVDKDENGYYSIRESKLVYLLWNYVKELNKRIEKLERK